MPKSGAMKSSWKIGLIVSSVILLVCGSAAVWLVHKHRADEKKVVELANARRIRAEQGDPKAESELAYMYSHGQGVPQDYSEAFRWCRKSADQGYAYGEAGLAYMYLHGQGVSQDSSEALRWYRKAAEGGDAYAENNLGLVYEEGGLVPQDYGEALRWYRKAVDQNYPAAQYNLGNMYYYGLGVPSDVPEAYRLYRKAAAHGNEYSQRILGLRGRGISAPYAISFSVVAVGSLLLLMGPLFLKNNSWNRPSQSTTAAGLVGLCCVGLDVYAHSQFRVFPSELLASGFDFARYVLTGVFLFLLISVLTSLTVPKRAQVLLGILGISFLSFNMWATAFVTAHQALLSSPAAVRLFSTTNGLIVGMTVPLVVFLMRRKASGTAET
jgi:hypothetical protein